MKDNLHKRLDDLGIRFKTGISTKEQVTYLDDLELAWGFLVGTPHFQDNGLYEMKYISDDKAGRAALGRILVSKSSPPPAYILETLAAHIDPSARHFAGVVQR